MWFLTILPEKYVSSNSSMTSMVSSSKYCRFRLYIEKTWKILRHSFIFSMWLTLRISYEPNSMFLMWSLKWFAYRVSLSWIREQNP